jgi:two-component system, OmpR family, response regulator ArlR
MRILVAEDEVSIAKALKLMLERNKYAVDAVYNGNDALDYICAGEYDALVLDIMMPGMDGISVLREVRRRGISTPALFLTAKGEVEDRIAGLDAGADDYLPKPFAAGEFLARVRALVRRSGAYAPDVVTVGHTTLDCSRYVLSAPGGEVRLNNKEFQLMELFMRHRHQIFSAERLMDKIWGLESDADIDVVWTYIGFLRKKLREIGADVEVKTIRGAGYTLEETAC